MKSKSLTKVFVTLVTVLAFPLLLSSQTIIQRDPSIEALVKEVEAVIISAQHVRRKFQIADKLKCTVQYFQNKYPLHRSMNPVFQSPSCYPCIGCCRHETGV